VLILAPGKGYNVFAGRDASKALGKSSMNPEDLSADYSDLTEWELKVLDDWVAYYTKVWSFSMTGLVPPLSWDLVSCWFRPEAAYRFHSRMILMNRDMISWDVL